MNEPARRGACPGLLDPMPTGDGLLARLPQSGALAPPALAALCIAATRHGNGLIEVTARGSLQVRGLSPESSADFAAACRAAGIVETGGPPVIASPLGRPGPGAAADVAPLVESLRMAVMRFAGRVAPKVAVLVDDGGTLHLDAVAADIRLRALGDGRYHLGIAGDGGGARWLGAVAGAHAVAAIVALLDALAARGPAARGRDLTAQAAAVVARWAIPAAAPYARARAEFIGTHRLADGSLACGIGLAFGQAEAAAVAALASAASEAGASAIAPAPGRVLLVFGLAADCATAFLREAGKLGFVTGADDLRRRVIACAGAPACAAGLMPARAIAGDMAAMLAPLLARGGTVHLSGCAKGCASRDVATLTLVATEAGVALMRDGKVGDRPVDVVPLADLSHHLERLAVMEPA